MRRHNPWRAIANHDHIHVRLIPNLPAETGGGVLVVLDDGDAWILIDRNLPRSERDAILTHELEHLRRGALRWDGAPPLWATVVASEERRIDRTVAELLVPACELQRFVRQRATVEAVAITDVAEHFDVPERIAVMACEKLLGNPSLAS